MGNYSTTDVEHHVTTRPCDHVFAAQLAGRFYSESLSLDSGSALVQEIIVILHDFIVTKVYQPGLDVLIDRKQSVSFAKKCI